MRKDKCDASLARLELEGYSVMRIKMVNTSTGEEETIDINPEDLFGPGKNQITESVMDNINMMLYIKDKCNVSGGAYHQICKRPRMPWHYKTKDHICELNKV